MKITGMNQAMGVYQAQSSPSKIQKRSFSSQSKDTLSLSNTAKEYQIALQALSQTPDIRKEKVDVIKERIQSGTYNVTGKEVADKLVKQFLDVKG